MEFSVVLGPEEKLRFLQDEQADIRASWARVANTLLEQLEAIDPSDEKAKSGKLKAYWNFYNKMDRDDALLDRQISSLQSPNI